MKRNVDCLCCGVQLQYLKAVKIQLGQTGWILGDLPNLLAGAMQVDVFCCPQCGKVEIYRCEEESYDRIAQKQCPRCGQMHDIDYPKCPFCKFDYMG